MKQCWDDTFQYMFHSYWCGGFFYILLRFAMGHCTRLSGALTMPFCSRFQVEPPAHSVEFFFLGWGCHSSERWSKLMTSGQLKARLQDDILQLSGKLLRVPRRKLVQLKGHLSCSVCSFVPLRQKRSSSNVSAQMLGSAFYDGFKVTDMTENTSCHFYCGV